jgi:hypothetical protein
MDPSEALWAAGALVSLKGCFTRSAHRPNSTFLERIAG